MEDLNNCFCEASLKNFIALENKGYKRGFHRPFEDDDILFIYDNEIKTFERKNLIDYSKGSFLNREINFNNETRSFEFI